MTTVIREVLSRTHYIIRIDAGSPLTPEHANETGRDYVARYYGTGSLAFDLGMDLIRASVPPPKCGCGGWAGHPEPCVFLVETEVTGPTEYGVRINGVLLDVDDARALADELNGAAEPPDACSRCGGFVQPGNIDGLCADDRAHLDERDDLARRFPGRWT